MQAFIFYIAITTEPLHVREIWARWNNLSGLN